MKNNKTLSALFFALITIPCLNPLGQEALAGNFSRSCSNIVLERGQILRANCKDRDANYRRTALDLNRGIQNRNGYLQAGEGYVRTCTNIGWSGGVNLRADCRTYNGDWRYSELDLDSIISNIDGNLIFD